MVPQRVIDKITALKAEAAILLEKIQAVKKDLRETDQATAGVIESNPEAAVPTTPPEEHERKMVDYFRLLRFQFLNRLRTRFEKGDRDLEQIEDRAEDLIEMGDSLIF